MTAGINSSIKNKILWRENGPSRIIKNNKGNIIEEIWFKK